MSRLWPVLLLVVAGCEPVYARRYDLRFDAARDARFRVNVTQARESLRAAMERVAERHELSTERSAPEHTIYRRDLVGGTLLSLELREADHPSRMLVAVTERFSWTASAATEALEKDVYEALVAAFGEEAVETP